MNKQLQQALYILKESVIGIFVYHSEFERFHVLVTAHNDSTIYGIEIKQLASFDSIHGMSTVGGLYLPFPDGKNMNQMIQDVVGWLTYMKQFDDYFTNTY